MYLRPLFNPYNPRPEYHEEQDPSIDEAIRVTARRLEHGMPESEAFDLLVASGHEEGNAYNVVCAAFILATAPSP